jgi:hypothetical protein
MSVTATIRIQEGDFDAAQEIAALTKGRTDIGAAPGERRDLLRRVEIGGLDANGRCDGH